MKKESFPISQRRLPIGSRALTPPSRLGGSAIANSQVAYPLADPQTALPERGGDGSSPQAANSGNAWGRAVPTPFLARRAAAGMALIITLILLAVITFMAVTFLVLSQRNRNSVTIMTNQRIALGATQIAVQRSCAETMAAIKASSNAFNYDLKVSTNYINAAGFVPGIANPANVSYYDTHGVPLSGANALQNLANLLFSPRPPVYVRVSANSNEFRYYLDSNRNGRPDANGWGPDFEYLNGVLQPVTIPGANGQIIPLSFWVGDPEWVGVLEKPEYPHSATNQFVSRYAYIILPASKTLDLNCIHNYAKGVGLGPNMSKGDGFMRNQGAGPHEINLAALLVDLNTNLWPFPAANPVFNFQPYTYRPVYNLAADINFPNTGAAFDDALALLRYRYSSRWSTPARGGPLQSVFDLFGLPGARALSLNGVDDYATGPLMTNTWWPVAVDTDAGLVNAFPYPAAPNPYNFFTPQDYFNTSKVALGLPPTAINFSNRLWLAGSLSNSYNAYTYYTMLRQLGTDSAPQPPTQLNLNYMNVDANGNVVPNMATNFVSWTNSAQFFTNVAIRLLANAGFTAGTGPANLLVTNTLGYTNLQIQIWPTNFYTPSVQRLFQLAANIYDATTNRADLTGYPYLPSVFRPLFGTAAGATNLVVNIIGFRALGDGDLSLAGQGGPYPTPVMRDLTIPRDRAALVSNSSRQYNDMVYGFPVVIGAKKGLPNFNEFSMQTLIQPTRRLEFRRQTADPSSNINETNQMYTLCISNVFGVEAWNSYVTNFPRDLQLVVAADTAVVMTNDAPVAGSSPLLLSNWITTTLNASPLMIRAGTWSGIVNAQNPSTASFVVPLNPASNAFLFLTNSTYRDSLAQFVPLNGAFERHPGTSAFPVPHWWLNFRTRLRFILIDPAARRIVDYVNLDSQEPTLDLTWTLQMDAVNYPFGSGQTIEDDSEFWTTNRILAGGIFAPTTGIQRQMGVSFGDDTPPSWNNSANAIPPGLDTKGAIDFFGVQFGRAPRNYPGAHYQKTNLFYTPFNPTRNVFFKTSWQANDPLVHYTIGDLVSPTLQTNLFQGNPLQNRIEFDNMKTPPVANIGQVNNRYMPWGGGPAKVGTPNDTTPYDMTLKDPLVNCSDAWDFPANKFPNVGWLGRVHRGTPWQTVYLKYSPPYQPGVFPSVLARWSQWSGNCGVVTNFGQLSPSLAAVVPTGTAATLNNLMFDASFTYPTNDWYILDLFTTATSDSASRGQMSINQTGLAAWSALLTGVDVMPDLTTNFVIPPAGTYSPTSPPPLVTLVNAINNVRAANPPVGVFNRLGDLLKVPELTTNSPFLNPLAWRQATKVAPNGAGLSDAVIERLPQQILGLLKGGEQPRFVIYAYGQALKPANNSIVPSGPFLGLCTNYQITAETATRTVVRIDGAPNNPRATIESYSVLPPD